MTRLNSSSIKRLDAALRAQSDPDRAVAQKAYLKSSRVHLGLPVGLARKVTRTWVREEGITDHDQVWEVVPQLWDSDVYESLFAAVDVLSYRDRALEVGDLATLRSMISDSQTWALVDPLSCDVVGSIIAAHPASSWSPTLDAWSTDPSFWVRRASMLCQLRVLRDPSYDPSRFFSYADAMIDEKEFFIRKVIGWVLRDMSKTRQTTVFEWVLPRSTELSGVSIREAVKYLTDEQRAMIEQQRRTN